MLRKACFHEWAIGQGSVQRADEPEARDDENEAGHDDRDTGRSSNRNL